MRQPGLRLHPLLQVSLCLVTLTAALVAGCKEHVLHIDLPAGYNGVVEITCDATARDPKVITVDAVGRARVATCPLHPMEVLLTREGRQIYPDGAVQWPLTGDGIPVGIQFAVR